MLTLLSPDLVYVAFSNRLQPAGAQYDLSAFLQNNLRMNEMFVTQRYELRSALASGDAVALETNWSGTLAAPLEALRTGDVIRGSLAVFLEFRGGRIIRQRNYHCFAQT